MKRLSGIGRIALGLVPAMIVFALAAILVAPDEDDTEVREGSTSPSSQSAAMNSHEQEESRSFSILARPRASSDGLRAGVDSSFAGLFRTPGDVRLALDSGGWRIYVGESSERVGDVCLLAISRLGAGATCGPPSEITSAGAITMSMTHSSEGATIRAIAGLTIDGVMEARAGRTSAMLGENAFVVETQTFDAQVDLRLADETISLTPPKGELPPDSGTESGAGLDPA
jgi:hypothetical protein